MNTTYKKILFATSIAATAIGFIFLVVNLLPFLTGKPVFLEPDVRNVGIPTLIFALVGGVALIAAGISGLLLRNNPKKWFIPLIASGAAVISWTVFAVFMNLFIKAERENSYAPDGTEIVIIIFMLLIAVAVTALYTVCMIKGKKNSETQN